MSPVRRFRMRLLFYKVRTNVAPSLQGITASLASKTLELKHRSESRSAPPISRIGVRMRSSCKQDSLSIVTDVSLGIADVETAVSATSPEEVAVEQVKLQEQQRVFGIVPNFYVTYEHDPAPLTPKLKFQLAMKALTDPVTIAGFGMNAAIYQAAGLPELSPGSSWLRKTPGKLLLPAVTARCCWVMRDFLRYCIRTHATSTRARARRNPAFSMRWQLRFSPEETMAGERSTTRTSWATWPPARSRTPTIPARTAAQDSLSAAQRSASVAVWFLASSRSSCFISGRGNTPISPHTPNTRNHFEHCRQKEYTHPRAKLRNPGDASFTPFRELLNT